MSSWSWCLDRPIANLHLLTISYLDIVCLSMNLVYCLVSSIWICLTKSMEGAWASILFLTQLKRCLSYNQTNHELFLSYTWILCRCGVWSVCTKTNVGQVWNYNDRFCSVPSSRSGRMNNVVIKEARLAMCGCRYHYSVWDECLHAMLPPFCLSSLYFIESKLIFQFQLFLSSGVNTIWFIYFCNFMVLKQNMLL